MKMIATKHILFIIRGMRTLGEASVPAYQKGKMSLSVVAGKIDCSIQKVLSPDGGRYKGDEKINLVPLVVRNSIIDR